MRAAILALLLMAAPAWAATEPDEVLADPALEARARQLGTELRCVVCAGESIESSSAGVARDLRLLVRERLVAGDTDDEALDYVVARYGEGVLLRPRFGGHTLALWLMPAGLLVLGGVGAATALRRRGRGTGRALSAEEAEEVERLR
ncbi:cytochrome c-type biogenesis protein CcmH [Hasllibacter halocynthiae]|uniref:Cytochrome c-type biogenesis protein n=1 Tax=Hasllibacter halocynthiae TaxID=595589 RepID=A0A2T0X6S2_9RHOB|nr:cytochrome c-type biogenesis protein [Hasllibacter halocynthiae]PRY94623.1 cytochrome c-type biogenesis protein CcmH [Hasllibacter halocynthiae]